MDYKLKIISVIKLSVIAGLCDGKTFEKGENAFIFQHAEYFNYNNRNISGKVAASVKKKEYEVKVWKYFHSLSYLSHQQSKFLCSIRYFRYFRDNF